MIRQRWQDQAAEDILNSLVINKSIATYDEPTLDMISSIINDTLLKGLSEEVNEPYTTTQLQPISLWEAEERCKDYYDSMD